MVRRLLTIATVATAGVLALIAPASASVSSQLSSHSAPVVASPAERPSVVTAADTNCYGGYTYDGGALACFVPYGEHLWVCDAAADGHHPGVWYRINSGSWVNAQYDLGAGNCHDINLSIAESGYITFYAVNYEGPTALSYSDTFLVSASG